MKKSLLAPILIVAHLLLSAPAALAQGSVDVDASEVFNDDVQVDKLLATYDTPAVTLRPKDMVSRATALSRSRSARYGKGSSFVAGGFQWVLWHGGAPIEHIGAWTKIAKFPQGTSGRRRSYAVFTFPEQSWDAARLDDKLIVFYQARLHGHSGSLGYAFYNPARDTPLFFAGNQGDGNPYVWTEGFYYNSAHGVIAALAERESGESMQYVSYERGVNDGAFVNGSLKSESVALSSLAADVGERVRRVLGDGYVRIDEHFCQRDCTLTACSCL